MIVSFPIIFGYVTFVPSKKLSVLFHRHQLDLGIYNIIHIVLQKIIDIIKHMVYNEVQKLRDLETKQPNSNDYYHTSTTQREP